MTYGEMKDFVLQLLNQYSVAGGRVALTYNNQADDVARIPGLLRDGLYYVTTTARRLRTTADLTDPTEQGDMLVYDLPDDFYQMIGLLTTEDDGQLQWRRDYRMVGGRQVHVPKSWGGSCVLEYYRYPHIPDDMEEDWQLDCPPEAHSALGYYAVAHLAMEDDSFLYGALYAEFERKMARLSEGTFTECGRVEDVYA